MTTMNTATGEPFPVGPEGECPLSGETCVELCQRLCGDRLAD